MSFSLARANKELKCIDHALKMSLYHAQNGRTDEAESYRQEFLDSQRQMRAFFNVGTIQHTDDLDKNEAQCSEPKPREHIADKSDGYEHK